MKFIFALLGLLYSSLTVAQAPACISKGQAVHLASEQFLNEYFQIKSSSVFTDTFGLYFSYGGLNENLQGVKDAFFTEEYSFDGLSHNFVSTHTLNIGDDRTYIQFTEFEVNVSCLRSNKITTDSTTDSFQNY